MRYMQKTEYNPGTRLWPTGTNGLRMSDGFESLRYDPPPLDAISRLLMRVEDGGRPMSQPSWITEGREPTANEIDRGYYDAIFAGDAPPNMMLGEPENCVFVKVDGKLVAHTRNLWAGELFPLPAEQSDSLVAALKARIGVTA